MFILVELFGGCFCASWFDAVVFDTSIGNTLPLSLIQNLNIGYLIVTEQESNPKPKKKSDLDQPCDDTLSES